MNGRIYDPVIAQFVQPDSLLRVFYKWVIKKTGFACTYVRGNPFRYADPSG